MDNLKRETTEFQKIVKIQDRLAKSNKTQEREENIMNGLQNTGAKVNETQEREEMNMMKLQNTTREADVQEVLAEVEEIKKEIKDIYKLPEIKPQDKSAVLCKSGDYFLNIMGVVNRTTKRMKGYKLFLSDTTGMVYIGSGEELVISKERLKGADNIDVLNIVNQFQVNFSEDNLKTAYERAKKFMEVSKQASCDDLEKNIVEVYREVIACAMNCAKEEEKRLDIKYDEVTKVVSIRDKNMQEVLDRIDPNYTKVKFCKKLVLMEDLIDEKIIIRNRSGNKGYGYNETANKMYYKFRIIDKMMNAGA